MAIEIALQFLYTTISAAFYGQYIIFPSKYSECHLNISSIITLYWIQFCLNVTLRKQVACE